jgi:hypothetical protein
MIGVVGFVVFNYGRREGDLRAAGAGIAMCVYPYFVTSLLVLWGVFVLMCAGLWAWSRWGE